MTFEAKVSRFSPPDAPIPAGPRVQSVLVVAPSSTLCSLVAIAVERSGLAGSVRTATRCTHLEEAADAELLLVHEHCLMDAPAAWSAHGAERPPLVAILRRGGTAPPPGVDASIAVHEVGTPRLREVLAQTLSSLTRKRSAEEIQADDEPGLPAGAIQSGGDSPTDDPLMDRLLTKSRIATWTWHARDNRFTTDESWLRLFGAPNPESIDTPDVFFERIQRDDAPRAKDQVALLLDGRAQQSTFEVRMLDHEGRSLTIACELASEGPAGGLPTRVGCLLRDVTESRRREQSLFQEAHYDSLTGLPNRTLLYDRASIALRRREHSFGILFIDLDDFKTVNDTGGHELGDEYLQAIAERLQETLRAADTVARIGGDEFVALLEDVECSQELLQLATRLQEILKHPIELSNGVEYAAGASIGAYLSPPDDKHRDSVETTLSKADEAMYEAKRRGKGCVYLYGDLGRTTREVRALTQNPSAVLPAVKPVRLHQIESNQEHPELRALRVLPHSERGPRDATKLRGVELTYELLHLRSALAQASHAFARKGNSTEALLAIPCPGLLLSQEDFVDGLLGLLERAAIPLDKIRLCIREENYARLPDRLRVVERLRELGVGIWLDQFGRRQGCLSYLEGEVDGILVSVGELLDRFSANTAVTIVESIYFVAASCGREFVLSDRGAASPDFLRRLDARMPRAWIESSAPRAFATAAKAPPEAQDAEGFEPVSAPDPARLPHALPEDEGEQDSAAASHLDTSAQA